MYKNLVVHTAILVAVLAIVNYVAVVTHLYAILTWFDVVTHVWGGAVVGFGVLALLWRVFPGISPLARGISWLTVVTVIGLGWEFYEYIVAHIAQTFSFDPFDTRMDIINDLLGAYVAYIWTQIFISPRFMK